jgi:hypothetical protein
MKTLHRKTLNLSLYVLPFNVMKTGEKLHEFRRPSKWILSRLLNKSYDEVKFVNGFGAKRPTFTREYLGYTVLARKEVHSYSNGLTVIAEKGDIKISLGEIIPNSPS